MRRLLIPFLVIPVLFICGCGSSSSGGSSAPDANYSGDYVIAAGDATTGVLTIVQDGSKAALAYVASGCTSGFCDALGNTGVGKVKGRKIDVTWETGAFTRLEFTADGSSFNAYGDVSFAGVKES